MQFWALNIWRKESQLEEGKGLHIFPIKYLATGDDVYVLLRPGLHRI